MGKTPSILTAILFILLFCSQCKKTAPDQVLPPITQTGANTFGCKINGKVFVPYWPCNIATFGTTELGYWVRPVHNGQQLPLTFVLRAGEYYGSGSSTLSIAFIQQSTYIYGPGNIADSLAITCSPIDGQWLFYDKYLNLGHNVFQVTKLDTVNNIFSGTFSLILYYIDYFSNSNGVIRDSVAITDGRFDLKMGIQYEKDCSN